MRLIDGNAIAQQVLAEVKARVAKLAPVVPHVAFVRVGDDPASVSYVTKKQKTAAEVGMKASLQLFPETVSKEELFAHLDALNAGNAVVLRKSLCEHRKSRLKQRTYRKVIRHQLAQKCGCFIGQPFMK